MDYPSSERCIVSDEERELIPIEQQTLLFYGKPIIVVRLPDVRPAVVIRFFCENMQIDTAAQIARIRRTETIAEDLALARVETEGGPQKMAVLVLHSVPFWLAGIDPKRVREEIRPEILHYQKEVVDVLYGWASAPKAIAAPTTMVPAEPVTQPARPADDAPLAAWREYYQRMLALVEWQMDVEEWRGHVETRLEGLEAITDLIPDILDRLGPQTLTPEHQKTLQYYVKQLHDATGKPYSMIYEDLKTAFAVPRYQEIPEAEWARVVNWFKVQIDRKKK
jgi:P22_AR N-terminal domain